MFVGARERGKWRIASSVDRVAIWKDETVPWTAVMAAQQSECRGCRRAVPLWTVKTVTSLVILFIYLFWAVLGLCCCLGFCGYLGGVGPNSTWLVPLQEEEKRHRHTRGEAAWQQRQERLGWWAREFCGLTPLPFPPRSPSHPKLGGRVQPGAQKERSPADFWPPDWETQFLFF